MIDSCTRITQCSKAQLGLAYLQFESPQRFDYNVGMAFCLSFPLSYARLNAAISIAIKRNESLRTRFIVTDEGLEGVVQEDASASLATVDVDHDEEVPNCFQSSFERPFDISASPAFRAHVFRSKRRTVLLLALHHCICDFEGVVALATELGRLYAEPHATSDSRRCTYSTQYIQDQARYFGSHRYAADLASYLKQFEAGPGFQIGSPCCGRKRGYSCRIGGPRPVSGIVGTVCRKHHYTVAAVVFAAFTLAVHRTFNARLLDTAVPISNRGDARVVGHFVETIIVRTAWQQHDATEAYLRRARRSLIAAIDWARIPLPVVGKQLQDTGVVGDDCMPGVMFVHRRVVRATWGLAASDDSICEWGGGLARTVKLRQQETQTSLALDCIEAEGAIDLVLKADLSRISNKSFDSLSAGVITILEQMANET